MTSTAGGAPPGADAARPHVTPGRGARGRRHRMALLPALVCLLSLSGCGWVSGWFDDDDAPAGAATISVFDVTIGQCFTVPEDVHTELTELTSVPCDQSHRQESYAKVEYQPPEGADPSLYPGEAALTTFAKGACAQAFTDYVGVSYLDSSLYFTYLLPSARGWQAGDDRSVVCFAITTGQALTTTVKGSKL